MRDDYDSFKAKAEIAVVTQGTPAENAELAARHGAQFRYLSDPEHRAYRAYGLGRGGFAQVMSPAILFKATLSALRGNVGRRVGDVFQMPGTFVIDREGIVRFCHRNSNASDNPPNAAVLTVLQAFSLDFRHRV